MSPWWIVVCFAFVLIGVTKSGFGSGLGLIVVPIMAIAAEGLRAQGLGAEAALGMMLPLLIVGDLFALWQQRKHASLALVRPLLVPTVLGVALGSLFLFVAHRHKQYAAALINLDIGFESVLLVGLHWYRTWRRDDPGHVFRPRPWHNRVAGATAGVSSTLAHGAGPIVALYLLPQRPAKQAFVGTCALFFFLLNTIKLPGYWWAGQFTAAPVGTTMRFVPLVLVGGLLGWWLNRRINDKLFGQIVYTGTFVLGWYLLWVGGTQLAHQLRQG
ncbi:MAG TPA: sulfite exporter TauE/SafE family protein [Tepidisphaeraceae bacterium]|nr:sulfite exporter TauE/SafE family protein [Tepidisphaeraceae bacterium]